MKFKFLNNWLTLQEQVLTNCAEFIILPIRPARFFWRLGRACTDVDGSTNWAGYVFRLLSVICFLFAVAGTLLTLPVGGALGVATIVLGLGLLPIIALADVVREMVDCFCGSSNQAINDGEMQPLLQASADASRSEVSQPSRDRHWIERSLLVTSAQENIDIDKPISSNSSRVIDDIESGLDGAGAGVLPRKMRVNNQSLFQSRQSRQDSASETELLPLLKCEK